MIILCKNARNYALTLECLLLLCILRALVVLKRKIMLLMLLFFLKLSLVLLHYNLLCKSQPVYFSTDITGVGDIAGDMLGLNVCHYV